MTQATEGHTVYEWTIGDRLRKAREYAGLDQQTLAADIGVARNTIRNYESGRTKPRTIVLRAWAARTGVAIEWLRTGVVPIDPGGDGITVRHQGLEPRTRWYGISAGHRHERDSHDYSASRVA